VLAVSIMREVAALYAGLVIVAIVRVVAKLSLVSRTFGISVIRPSANNLSDVLHFAKWGWLQGAGGLFFGVADRILIAAMLGATSLAHYSIATQLTMQIHALSAAGFSVLFPKVSRHLESNADYSLARITKLAMVLNFTTSSALAIGLLIFGESILTWWLGKAEAEACGGMLTYLIVAYWMLANNVVPYYILLGLGKIKIIGTSSILFGVLAIIIMYVVITIIGSDGRPAGRLAYSAFTLALIYPLMKQIYNRHKI
jgi:O-antigen/teichoic acid export membrane protein